jgi:translation initiation factor 2 gamma subunit (eIF-2gamma)
MLKNIILLVLLTWISLTYAKQPHHDVVAHETMIEAESYRVEKPAAENEAARGVAGSKIKRNKAEVKSDGAESTKSSDSDSEVRYWQYSE